MRNSYKKLFSNKIILYEMINLRRIGISSYSLAIFYGCDRKAIEAQCNKYEVISEVPEVFRIERIATEILRQQKQDLTRWAYIDGERICLGRSYKDYIKK